MARRPLTSPRKQASQQRSRTTVNALIQATARILVREGFDKASTNRIAATAGVSVGSLYQYFPSKEALVAAVIERHNEEIMQTVRSELADIDALPLAQGVRKLIAVAVQAHRIDPRLHRVLAVHRRLRQIRGRFEVEENWGPVLDGGSSGDRR